MYFRHHFGVLGANHVLPIPLVLGLGCSSAPSDIESIARVDQPIASEHGGGIAQAAPRLYRSPDVTLTGYAIPSIGGCTAEMIGPNVMMTAAHCGDGDPTATFFVYRNEDPTNLVTESFSCHILINTFWGTDFTLHFCDPNAAGESPGDKYGYLDFDHSQPAIGQSVYSYWYNPIGSLGLPNAEIYSQGAVTSTTTVIWGGNVSTPMNDPVGISTDLWTQPGASGSPILNAANFRILIAPTSTGFNDAPGRSAQAVKTDFERGSVDGWDDPTYGHITGIHDANLAARGLVPSAYAGLIDKNHNYLFDVQEDLELIRGENRRAWYYLGFESERRNALFAANSVSFDTSNRIAHVSVTTPTSARPVLTHQKLPLPRNTDYRVSVMIYTNSASNSNALHVSFQSALGEESGADVPTFTSADYRLITFPLRTKSDNPNLVFAVTGTLDAYLAAVSVIRDDATMTFDSADMRFSWRNDNDGSRGVIVPDGESDEYTPAGANWAALALPSPARASGTDWPLRNRQLAILQGTWYRLCADVRSQAPLASGDTGNRAFRVLSAGYEATRAQFRPVMTWMRVCAPPFAAPYTDNNLQIGFEQNTASTGFYVDNISLTHTACVPKPNPCGTATCGTASDGCGTTYSCGSCNLPQTCSFGSCVCKPHACAKGSYWDPDFCACQKGLPS
jgi:hypothetical protein